MTLDGLPTPCLVLDLGLLKRNLGGDGRRPSRAIPAGAAAAPENREKSAMVGEAGRPGISAR